MRKLRVVSSNGGVEFLSARGPQREDNLLLAMLLNWKIDTYVHQQSFEIDVVTEKTNNTQKPTLPKTSQTTMWTCKLQKE